MITTTITGTDNVTLERAKKHLNISFNDDDDYLNSLITVSLSAVENYCRTAFIERSNEQVIGGFIGKLPSALISDNTYPPNNDIVDIEYTSGGSGESITVPLRNLYNYEKDHYVYSQSKIVISLCCDAKVVDNLEVSLKWSTGQKGMMDMSIVQARLLLIGTYYENRESVSAGASVSELPNGVSYLLDAYMNMQIG